MSEHKKVSETFPPAIEYTEKQNIMKTATTIAAAITLIAACGNGNSRQETITESAPTTATSIAAAATTTAAIFVAETEPPATTTTTEAAAPPLPDERCKTEEGLAMLEEVKDAINEYEAQFGSAPVGWTTDGWGNLKVERMPRLQLHLLNSPERHWLCIGWMSGAGGNKDVLVCMDNTDWAFRWGIFDYGRPYYENVEDRAFSCLATLAKRRTEGNQ